MNNTPIKNPSNNDNTTSNNGSIITEKASTVPTFNDFAIPNEIAKIIKPTASSNATTGNNTSVTGPLALYCLTTINVAAGAVAVATDARITATDKGSLSGIIKCNPINTASTIIVVKTAWKIPIIVACLPIFLS